MNIVNSKPRTRKKADPAPAATFVEETPVSETPAETPVKKGRKPSPLTVVLRDFEKAKARLARAEKKATAVADVQRELTDAQGDFEDAKNALDNVYASLTA